MATMVEVTLLFSVDELVLVGIPVGPRLDVDVRPVGLPVFVVECECECEWPSWVEVEVAFAEVDQEEEDVDSVVSAELVVDADDVVILLSTEVLLSAEVVLLSAEVVLLSADVVLLSAEVVLLSNVLDDDGVLVEVAALVVVAVDGQAPPRS